MRFYRQELGRIDSSAYPVQEKQLLGANFFFIFGFYVNGIDWWPFKYLNCLCLKSGGGGIEENLHRGPRFGGIFSTFPTCSGRGTWGSRGWTRWTWWWTLWAWEVPWWLSWRELRRILWWGLPGTSGLWGLSDVL